MRQSNPARAFYALLTLLAVLAGIVLLASLILNSDGWLRRMRQSLSVGIHSPLYADYSADLRGVLMAPVEMNLLEDTLRDQQTDPEKAIDDLLTPVPTITPQFGTIYPTATGQPTATLAFGITPTLTWTPTFTVTNDWAQPTATTGALWPTNTARPATQSPTHTAAPTNPPPPTPTPIPQPTATHVPQPTATSGSYPPPVVNTPVPTEPAYP